jgi:hypothetical protein
LLLLQKHFLSQELFNLVVNLHIRRCIFGLHAFHLFLRLELLGSDPLEPGLLHKWRKGF